MAFKIPFGTLKATDTNLILSFYSFFLLSIPVSFIHSEMIVHAAQGVGILVAVPLSIFQQGLSL